MKKILIIIVVCAFFLSCKKNPVETNSLREIHELLATAAQQRNVSKEKFMKTLVDVNRFTSEQNVFLPSALAVDFTKKWVTLPLYTGIGANGNPVYYIITEAADYEVAKIMESTMRRNSLTVVARLEASK